MEQINNKNILFIANGSKEWIGGLYYVKNIIYTLEKRNIIGNSTNIYILVKNENVELFKTFSSNRNIHIVIYKNNIFNKIVRKGTFIISKRILDLELLNKVKKFNVDYIYPINYHIFLFLKNKNIYWIPDFQHVHLPDMFSKKEVSLRNKTFSYIAKNHKLLILSSNDAYNDYKSLYPDYTENVKVFSFESDIRDEVKHLNNKLINETIKKYNLPQNFIFLPNQFWKHKNHITAFKAVNFIVNKLNKNIILVCTGNTHDNRNKEYYNELLSYIKQNNLEKNIIILGFIPRRDQLALMKASLAVLQPSLFEGWGTVVEDAKVLNKKIILSDINVHYEQKNENCIIFKRDDDVQLGNILSSFL